MSDPEPSESAVSSSKGSEGESKLGTSPGPAPSSTIQAAPSPPLLVDTSTIYGPNAPGPGYDRPTKACLQRIYNDLQALREEPIEGIFVVPDETRANTVHALLVGPPDTPYERGLFVFELCFPDDYPHSPPHVIHVTTGRGRVRMNPNLYATGQVCLSILGTWAGPGWSSVQTLAVRFVCCYPFLLFAGSSIVFLIIIIPFFLLWESIHRAYW